MIKDSTYWGDEIVKRCIAKKIGMSGQKDYSYERYAQSQLKGCIPLITKGQWDQLVSMLGNGRELVYTDFEKGLESSLVRAIDRYEQKLEEEK